MLKWIQQGKELRILMEKEIIAIRSRRYEKLEQLFDGVVLTSQEEKTLLWLSEWSDETVNNLISVIEKRLKNEQDKKQK